MSSQEDLAFPRREKCHDIPERTITESKNLYQSKIEKYAFPN